MVLTLEGIWATIIKVSKQNKLISRLSSSFYIYICIDIDVDIWHLSKASRFRKFELIPFSFFELSNGNFFTFLFPLKKI